MKAQALFLAGLASHAAAQTITPSPPYATGMAVGTGYAASTNVYVTANCSCTANGTGSLMPTNTAYPYTGDANGVKMAGAGAAFALTAFSLLVAIV